MTRPSGTVTFLMTDIEGSTQLWERHADAMASALATHDAILRDTVVEHGGEVVKTTGDGMLAVFDRADRAVNAAIAIQRALAGTAWGQTGPIRVRAALHAGDAESRDGDYFGPAVNRVARLLAIGHGGQVLASRAAAALARGRLSDELEVVELGEHRLRDLEQAEDVVQVVAPGLERSFPPLRSLGSYRTNLPAQVTSFIGREREVARLEELLTNDRLVTLVGTGGTGKSRLMVQASAELLDRYPDGVWLVELAPVTDPSVVIQEVATTLGVSPEPGRELLATLCDFLRAKTVLLLIDNCEHVIEAVARLVERLLASAPKIRIVASSREALGVPGEVVFQVPSLGIPDEPASVVIDDDASGSWFAAVADADAVRLFIDRARSALPSFALTPVNARAIVEICRRLDGIPLAIELAAARVNVLSVEEIAVRLGDRFRLLTGGRRTALPRQQTLQALVDWSWDLLDDADRTLLARLSVFAGGWTLDDAAAVTGVERDDALATLDGLSRLVDRSLVAVDHGEATRYRMLETIRQYARDKLVASGEAERIRGRHLDRYDELAQEARRGLRGSGMVTWLLRIDRELDNLRAATEWAFESDPPRALRMTVALKRYWEARAGADSVETLHRAASLAMSWIPLDVAADGDRARLAAATLAAAAQGHATWADARPAISWAETAVSLARELDATDLLAEALSGLILAKIFSGERDGLDEVRETALVAAERAEAWWVIAMLQSGAAELDVAAGDPASAQRRLAAATDAAAKSGNPFALAFTALGRGSVSGYTGDLEGARHWFGEAIRRYEELGDHRFQLIARSDLAHALRRARELDEALALYHETVRVWQHLGNRGAIANQLESLAFIAMARGRSALATQLLGAASGIRQAADAAMLGVEQLEFDSAVATLREQLGAAEFDARWAEGRALKATDAVALALTATEQREPERAGASAS